MSKLAASLLVIACVWSVAMLWLMAITTAAMRSGRVDRVSIASWHFLVTVVLWIAFIFALPS